APGGGRKVSAGAAHPRRRVAASPGTAARAGRVMRPLPPRPLLHPPSLAGHAGALGAGGALEDGRGGAARCRMRTVTRLVGAGGEVVQSASPAGTGRELVSKGDRLPRGGRWKSSG